MLYRPEELQKQELNVTTGKLNFDEVKIKTMLVISCPSTALGATQSLAGSSSQFLCVHVLGGHFACSIESFSLPQPPTLVSIRVLVMQLFVSVSLRSCWWPLTESSGILPFTPLNTPCFTGCKEPSPRLVYCWWIQIRFINNTLNQTYSATTTCVLTHLTLVHMHQWERHRKHEQ